MIPESGKHDDTCEFLCSMPSGVCQHSCSVCALKKKCTFCHAPPGQPCRTVLYEEHVEHGNGKEHAIPHSARREQYA